MKSKLLRNRDHYVIESFPLKPTDLHKNEFNSVRFKYFNFQALSEKNDFIRIHQLYEQLKFSVLSDEFNITEDQALTLASLQFFVDECNRKQIYGKNN